MATTKSKKKPIAFDELLGIKGKMNALTIVEIGAIMTTIATSVMLEKALGKDSQALKDIRAVAATVATAIEAYKIAVDTYNTVVALLPVVDQAAQAAQCFMNPGNIPNNVAKIAAPLGKVALHAAIDAVKGVAIGMLFATTITKDEKTGKVEVKIGDPTPPKLF